MPRHGASFREHLHPMFLARDITRGPCADDSHLLAEDAETRREMREMNDETRRHMRVLHQEVIGRFAIIQEGQPQRRRRNGK